MTGVLLNVSTRSSSGITAEPLSVEGVNDNDPDGYVPLDILQRGTRVVIPRWADPGAGDQLLVSWLQNSVEAPIFDNTYPTAVTDPFIYVDLTAAHMSMDGEAFIYYRVWKGGGGNSDDSPRRKLTINHAALLVLEEPSFPDATLWGYLNNNTVPPLTDGATVDAGIALAGDRNEVHWTGYRSLNGSGAPVQEAHGTWSRTLSLDDVNNGYSLVVPFEPHIRPLIDNDSALVFCRLYRGGGLIAESKKGLVRIDRVTPGESGPSGLDTNSMNAIGDFEMVAKLQPPKTRISTVRSGVVTVDADVEGKLADESISISILDSGNLIFTATNFADPQDNDELDLYYRVAGGTRKIIGTVEMGAATGRDDPFRIEVETSWFPEEQTPATPTRYEVDYEIYKAGGGNADASNIVEFSIDRTAPFEVKTPAKKKSKPTPAVNITNRPVAPSYILDEAWITANPKLICEVPVNYALRRDDDVLSYFLSSASPSVVLTVYEGTVTTAGEFEVDSAELRRLPNGTRISHSYQWRDLPGNLSLQSDATTVFDLRLAQDPVLLAPEVPKTNPGQTVPLVLDDFATGAPPVLAVVKLPEHGIATDQITLYVEDAADQSRSVPFGPLPLGTTDLEFTLDYASLASLFADATDPLEVKVWYEHERAGTILDSPVIYIYVDFVHAGPTNPDLPDLTNPNLDTVTVTGRSGTANIITPDDRDKAGTVSVPAWFGLPAVVGGSK